MSRGRHSLLVLCATLPLGACTAATPAAADAAASRPATASAATGTRDHAAADARDAFSCDEDVLVRFSPAVPRPGSQRFLTDLLTGSGYALTYRRTVGSLYLLRLTSANLECDAGVRLLRRDPRVQSVDVDERRTLPRAPAGGEAR